MIHVLHFSFPELNLSVTNPFAINPNAFYLGLYAIVAVELQSEKRGNHVMAQKKRWLFYMGVTCCLLVAEFC